MAGDAILVYIDVNVLLNPVLYDATTVPAAKASADFLTRMMAGEIKGITSVLSWDEFVWIIRKNTNVEVSRKKGRDLLTFPRLKFVPVSTVVIEKAQDLIEHYTLKPRDAIHAATGLKNDVAEFITLDEDFKNIAGIKYRKP